MLYSSIQRLSTRCPAPGTWQRKALLLLVCALVEGAFCVAFIQARRSLAIVPRWCYPAWHVTTSERTETGAFAVRRLNREAGHRTTLQVRGDNLWIENGRIGLLSTPLCKTVTIEGLSIKSYRHSNVGTQEDDTFSLSRTVRDLGNQFQEDFLGMEVRCPLLDARNATEVVIRDLDYALIRDDRVELAIRCHRAVIASSAGQIVLRGGVIIQNAEGDTLLSNHVVWDAREHRFFVPGTYRLNRGRNQVTGCGLQCDKCLCQLTDYETYARKGADQWMEEVSFSALSQQ